MHFDRNLLTSSRKGEERPLINYFKFGTSVGRFPSGGAASMAVEGLKPSQAAVSPGLYGPVTVS